MSSAPVLSCRAISPAELEDLFPFLLTYLRELALYEPPSVSSATPEGARQYLRHLAADPARHLWWTLLDGQRVGFACFRFLPVPPWSSEPAGLIDDFYILPPNRRQGLGRLAVEALVAYLRQRGAKGVRLNALIENEAAVAFWQAAGFRPLGTLLGTAYVMERPLEDA